MYLQYLEFLWFVCRLLLVLRVECGECLVVVLLGCVLQVYFGFGFVIAVLFCLLLGEWLL